MDYIFKTWEDKLKAMADSVEKDLEEIRKCKAEIQDLKVEMVAELKKARYVRDDQRLILSAPEIVIGNVDPNGTLFQGGSTIIIRGTEVGVQAASEVGTVELRAPSIRQIAEDPGVDGHEHVVGTLSSVVSQARDIVIQSNDAKGAFSAPVKPAGGSGVRIHADQAIDIHATKNAESREKLLGTLISDTEKQKESLKEEADMHKESFGEMTKEIQDLLDKKAKIVNDGEELRANFEDVRTMGDKIEKLSRAITGETYAYAGILAQLAEANRLLKCYKEEKDAITKGDDFKKKTTGAHVSIHGEQINLVSVDGEGNLRDNEGSGITLKANDVSVQSIEADGKLKEKGHIRLQAKTIDVTTAGEADAKYDDKGQLTDAQYAAEGDFTVTSKNITLQGVDYEVAEQKRKEKQLTADSTLTLRAKTMDLSTENVAGVEVDDNGKTTKANYTAEGDINIRSKTFSVTATDNDLENGERKEKQLTADSAISIRAEKISASATDTEGKATGSLSLNAKAVSVKAMDVDKEKLDDKSLAADGTLLLVSEKMFVGAKSKDIKSKHLQAVSEELGLFADKTLEAQQGDGKSALQLDGGKASLGGSNVQVFGKTELKDEVKAPKATIENLEAKTSFKSSNISDGIAVPGGPGGSLSTKLKAEDAKS